MNSNKRVYDDRTNKTLFIGTDIECVNFIQRYLFDYPNDDQYLWIGNTAKTKFYEVKENGFTVH